MIVHEIAEIVQFISIDSSSPLIIMTPQISHILVVKNSVPYPKEERIVQHSIQRAQISRKVAHISIKDLPDSIDPSSILELFPEPFWHFGYSVDSDPVDLVFLDQVADPLQQLCADPIVLLFQVGQTCQSAVLDSVLVFCGEVVVRDYAVPVVVVGRVEGHVLSVIFVQVAHMITHNINHNPNIPLMASINKINKILLGAKIAIQLINIPAPMPMIAAIPIINNRTDPNSIKSHSLNIIQIILQAPHSPHHSTIPNYHSRSDCHRYGRIYQ